MSTAPLSHDSAVILAMGNGEYLGEVAAICGNILGCESVAQKLCGYF
jgi:hypothetical protein